MITNFIINKSIEFIINSLKPIKTYKEPDNGMYRLYGFGEFDYLNYLGDVRYLDTSINFHGEAVYVFMKTNGSIISIPCKYFEDGRIKLDFI